MAVCRCAVHRGRTQVRASAQAPPCFAQADAVQRELEEKLRVHVQLLQAAQAEVRRPKQQSDRPRPLVAEAACLPARANWRAVLWAAGLQGLVWAVWQAIEAKNELARLRQALHARVSVFALAACNGVVPCLAP